MHIAPIATAAAALIAVSIPRPLPAQARQRPSDTLLAGITDRGRALAAYDVAAWHATDAVQALRPSLNAVNASVARQRDDMSWTVSFGRLTVAGDTFYQVYEAIQGYRADTFSVVTHDPPKPIVGYERAAAAAIRAAGAALARQTRPYNSYVLPAPGGEWWVYFLPAQTTAGIYPHGGDFRYRLSADGGTVIATRQMHRTVLESQLPDSAEFGYHTAIVDDVPEDSDVFLVLSRRPRRPELLVSACCFYQVHLNGSIEWRPREP